MRKSSTTCEKVYRDINLGISQELEIGQTFLV